MTRSLCNSLPETPALLFCKQKVDSPLCLRGRLTLTRLLQVWFGLVQDQSEFL